MKKDEQYHKQKMIDAYRAGKLSDEEIDELWAEMLHNPDQLDYLINSVNLETIASSHESLEQITANRPKQSNSNPVIYRISAAWMRYAAVFLVTIGILSTIYFFGTDYIFEPKPLSEIELNSYRSSSIPSSVFDYEVQRAINMASLENFDMAIQKLQEIEEADLTEEQKITLAVNKGSVYYNRGDYSSAEAEFQNILNEYDNLHLLTEEQAHWFLGNIYLQMGDEDKARVHIQKTYDLNGAYQRLAERYLR